MRRFANFEYSHKYQSLPLVPVEQFLAEHPEHAGLDENALTVARIENEREEREALEQQRQGLLKKKQGLIAENKKRKDDLANLDKDLEKFIDVSLYLQRAKIGNSDLAFYRLPNRYKRPLKRSFNSSMIRGGFHLRMGNSIEEFGSWS